MPGNVALQTFLNSRRAGKLAFSLSRLIPPVLGFRLACWIARRIAARPELPLVQALRVNQWVAAGGEMSSVELDRSVQASLEQIAIAFFQLFRTAEDAAALEDLIVFTPQLDEIIARSREKRCGLLVAGLHMSGFDLVAQAAAHRGLKAIGLSLPEANQTIEWQHEFRRRSGLEILPATLPNLRHTVQRLAAGELVLTGIDRPMPDLKYRPLFFGRPAALPIHHIYLAQKAGVPIVVMGAEFDGRKYHVLSSGEITMQHYPDRTMEMVKNAERVLEAAQEIISHARQQWTVPHPVWPEAVSVLPGPVR